MLDYALQIAKQWVLWGWDVSLMSEDFCFFLLQMVLKKDFFFLVTKTVNSQDMKTGRGSAGRDLSSMNVLSAARDGVRFFTCIPHLYLITNPWR